MNDELRSNSVTNLIHQHCKDIWTVLNLGCGLGQHAGGLPAKHQLHVDVWPQYLDQIKDMLPTIKLDITNLSMFVDKSWDVVMCIDVIEHLTKENAEKAITEMERIARKKVVLYTPIGFHKQDDGQGWGAGNPEYQAHRCGFTTEEMTAKGYTSVRSREYPIGQFCVKTL